MKEIKKKLNELELEITDYKYITICYDILQPGNGSRIIKEIETIKERLNKQIESLTELEGYIKKEMEDLDEEI